MSSTPSTPDAAPSASRSLFVRTAPIIAVGVILLLIAGSLAFAAERRTSFDGRIYPGVSIADTDVGGLRPEEAATRLEQTIQSATASGLSFQLNTSTRTLAQAKLRELIQYDQQTSIQEAYALGRGKDTLRSLFGILGLTIHHRNVALSVTVDDARLSEWLRTSTSGLLPEAKNARLVIDLPSATSSTVRIESEQTGQTIQIEPALQEVARQAQERRFSPIQLAIQTLEPAIRRSDLEPLQSQATSWLAHAPFSMTLDGRSWSVSPSMLAGWITATTTQSIGITLDRSRLAQDLAPWLVDKVRPAKDGKLELDANNALKTFVAPEEGVMLDLEHTTANIQHVLEATSSTAPIVLTLQTPTIVGAEAMGIREVIGIGTSDFSGSPSNRRKNIALGAQHVNGSLVAPDAEFSLLKVLGEIDGAHGWFPELVIKGNKTTPEFGGGLCQIGTTVFRAAMNSGLVITERRNHSYRVRYYEPAGTDATIYDPAPDFRFKNDTGHWVLITTEMHGDKLVFSVWGTKDGRVVEPLKPTVSNIVAPPPKKLIPTTDLAPGQTKCTETAHAGATAKLDYVVTYASGEVKKTTFTSYYKPWGAVCLVGTAQAAPVVTGVDETGINNPN